MNQGFAFVPGTHTTHNKPTLFWKMKKYELSYGHPQVLDRLKENDPLNGGRSWNDWDRSTEHSSQDARIRYLGAVHLKDRRGEKSTKNDQDIYWKKEFGETLLNYIWLGVGHTEYVN